MKVLARLDIQKIQYMNIFEKIIKIKAQYCFLYDNTIIFTVPKKFVTRAIGKNAKNVNKLSARLNRKIKIVATPTSPIDLDHFISVIIFPHRFKKLSLENHELVIYSAPREKAALIGRGKKRLKKLSEVLERFFNIKKVTIK